MKPITILAVIFAISTTCPANSEYCTFSWRSGDESMEMSLEKYQSGTNGVEMTCRYEFTKTYPANRTNRHSIPRYFSVSSLSLNNRFGSFPLFRYIFGRPESYSANSALVYGPRVMNSESDKIKVDIQALSKFINKEDFWIILRGNGGMKIYRLDQGQMEKLRVFLR